LTLIERDPVISKTKRIIYNYLLQEVNSGTEKIICNPIYLPDLFREDCLKPFKDEDEDNDDVV